MEQDIHPIRVGLCGWGDHNLYPAQTPSREKLSIYAQTFPVVELDSTYHAIPSYDRMEKWAKQTPEGFQFVIKAYRELTGHGRRQAPNPIMERDCRSIFRSNSADERRWKSVDAFISISSLV